MNVQMHKATECLAETQNLVAGNSSSAADQANNVSSSSEQVSVSVSAVAAHSSQMSASIREISARTSEAAMLSRDARESAQQTMSQAHKLSASADEINTRVQTWVEGEMRRLFPYHYRQPTPKKESAEA